MKIELIGMDVSMRNFGFAKAVYDTETGAIEVVDLNLAETKPADKATKKKIRQNCLDLDAAKEMQHAMVEQCKGMTLALVEVPVGSQSARAMMSCGLCIGVLSSCPIPIIPVTPTQVKKAGFGVASATKEEQIEWATEKYPDAPWMRVKSTGKLLGKNEHLADAVAAIHAGVETEEFKALIAIIAQMSGQK